MWNALAALVVGLLKLLIQQEQAKAAVLRQVEKRLDDQERQAMAWFLASAGRPGAGDLRVQPGAPRLRPPDPAPDPQGRPPPGELPGG